MRSTLALLLAVASLAAAAKPARFTDEELKAVIPSDLGPDTIVVSEYAPEQRKNHALFMEKCSICHTPARAINSTIVSREDWSRFVRLMHSRYQVRGNEAPWTKKEIKQLVDFMVYDSQIRKIDRKEEFEALQKRLADRFQEVQAEKRRRSF